MLPLLQTNTYFGINNSAKSSKDLHIANKPFNKWCTKYEKRKHTKKRNSLIIQCVSRTLFFLTDHFLFVLDVYAFCSCVLQFYTFCTNSAAFQAGSCVYALQYASERLPRHHFKTATYATQKPKMQEKTLCCQRRLRDAKTCFVFFRRLGIAFPGVVTRQYFTVPSRHQRGRSDPSKQRWKNLFYILKTCSA